MSDPPATQVDTVRPFSAPIAQAMYPVKIAGKYGYMDAMGSLVIAPQYDEASLFFEGVARASVLTEEGPRYALIFDDAANTEPDFAFIGDFDEMGMAPALYADTSMWGYINQAGQWLISPDFNQAEPFLGDRALVTYQEQEGSIDREGVFASLEELPPVLPTASAAPAEWPGLDPQRSLVFVSGENVVFSDRSNSLMGVADAQGETLIPSMYTTLMAAPNGGFLYGIVDSSGRLCYGLLSQDGAVVIPHAYRYLAPCPGDGAYIAQPVGNTGYGLLDEHSAWILEPEYVSIYYYDGILASVEKTDPMGISVRGYVNRQGEWVRVQNE